MASTENQPIRSPIVIIGGGPAGLRAAEVLSARHLPVTVYDSMPSVGRKFLVAGHGGLNLTHSEPVENFPQRYVEEPARWWELLAEFGPRDLCAWAESLGIETFVGTSGRIFPMEKKAAPLLRRWVARLKEQGVAFHLRRRWVGLETGTDGLHTVRFETPEGGLDEVRTSTVILALGGGSWPQTGSTGAWRELFAKLGVSVEPFMPANCGYEVEWKPEFLAQAEGQPLKNVTVTAGGKTVAGECLITRYGIEGGTIYALGRELRRMQTPAIEIDLKPTFSSEELVRKLGPGSEEVKRRNVVKHWKLGAVAAALVEHYGGPGTVEELARRVKQMPVTMSGPRPLEEAISTAGGVAWSELDEQLMLKKIPGVFCAGEMISWEGPTGGYLLQGCFTTGNRAALGAITWFAKK